jgi:uncharacterized protein (DUF427 family)
LSRPKESVWDYPRPPRLEHVERHVRVVLGGVVIAESRRPARVLETSHPPVYYVSPEDIVLEHLLRAGGSSFCEWKGNASYFDVQAGGVLRRKVAWSYARPTPPFEALAGCVAFYAAPMEACFVDDEQVTPQPGGFYGGWVTQNLIGPFKGGPGSMGW